jgi:hypothetical protein
MTWNQAQSWVAAMNAANYLGYSDWRLPVTSQPDASCGSQTGGVSYGYNCTGSELGHLFYQALGANASELAKFSNVRPDTYWSTEYAPFPNYAWAFWPAPTAGYGIQDRQLKTNKFLVWAVRSGDVAALPQPVAVPLPAAAVWLFGSALTGLTMLGVRRRRG